MTVVSVLATPARDVDAQPAPPATFAGRIDTLSPRDGLVVRAEMNGLVCGLSTTSVINGVMWYRVHVAARSSPDYPHCGVPGATVTIVVDGVVVATAPWEAGLTVLNIVGPPSATPGSSATPPATPRPPATGPGALSPGVARLGRPAESFLDSPFPVTLDLAHDAVELPDDEPPGYQPPIDLSNCTDDQLLKELFMTSRMWATVTFSPSDFSRVIDSKTGRLLSGTEEAANYSYVGVPGDFSWQLTPGRAAPDLPYIVLLAVDNGSGGPGAVRARWRCTVRVPAPTPAPTSTPTNTATPVTPTPTPIIGLSVVPAANDDVTFPLWLVIGGGGFSAAAGAGLLWGTGVLFLAMRRRRSPNVFLSYRRGDAAGWTGRIFDHLVREFGDEHVFQDVVDIEGGTDWVDELHEKVEECDVLIALIGDRWVGPKPDGTRRIDEDRDWVRLETARALAGTAIVIPVLVDGVRMSSLGELPEDLARLKRRNSIDVRADSFDGDMLRIIRAVRSSKRRKKTEATRRAQEDK